jgi:hypothetical protein
MLSSLLLLALLILPSALQQQGTLVERKIDVLVEHYRTGVDLIVANQDVALENQNSLSTDLGKIEAEAVSVRAQLETLLADFTLQSTEIREATQNATNQLLTELDTLRGRQAVSAAVQVSQVLMFVVYLLTTISVYIVKRCRKVREKSQRKEFELLEKKLLSNKAKRRAAAAKEKSAPAPSQE